MQTKSETEALLLHEMHVINVNQDLPMSGPVQCSFLVNLLYLSSQTEEA